MGNIFGGGADADDEEEDDERLRRWRPAIESHGHGALKRKKLSSKSSESSDEGSGQSDGGSVSSSASKLESESEKSASEAGDGSEKSDESGKQESSDEESGEDDAADLRKRELEKKKKKIVVRMDFEPLLSLHEPLAEDMEAPADLFAHNKKKRKAERAEKRALEDATANNRKISKAAAEWLTDSGTDECPLQDMAQNLGEDPDDLRYALVQTRRFDVDDDGIVKKALLQRILDVMESDIETVAEVVDKLEDVDAEAVKQAVKASMGELRLKTASEIDLIEHVDIEAEQKLQRAEEKEQRQKAKEERAKAKAKKKKGKGQDKEEEAEEEEESSTDDEEGANGINREAERKALAFRRVQVQRKIEEFLRVYTKGQNLTKINAKGKRYHRRVYIDTTRKSLVVQGANGPKFFPFASMKEVDIETRTTKEGRVETLVICAIEKRGRIIKELHLAFPDQARANTFVNCVTLFSLALRSATQKK
mmetsp:Transcript_100682/g.307730  ORF Transcript_100682/g.307730 Transcript_100682/m.307730 type:complete len:479 (-) Transcript_100682:30-1466(-)